MRIWIECQAKKAINISNTRQLLLLLLLLISTCRFGLFAQNAIVGSGFSTGWGNACVDAGNYTYFSTGAGTTYKSTALTPNGTGDQYWRFGIDWGGTYAQRTNTLATDDIVVPGTKYTLNTTCAGSGALKYNVSSTSNRFVFKTLDAGANPAGTWVFFDIGGTVQIANGTSRSPSGNVYISQPVSVTATLSGAFASGQSVYLRYSTNAFSTSSTIVEMTGSGTTYSATIPGQASGTVITYYMFTSGSGLTIAHADADLYSIDLLNNTGANYSYTVQNAYISNQTGNWNIGTTWVGGGVPPAGSDVIIDNTHNVTLDVSSTVNSLTINAGGTFTGTDGFARTLTINNGGALSNAGTFTATGTGTVAFAGTATVSSGLTFNNVTATATGAATALALPLCVVNGRLEMQENRFISSTDNTFGASSTLTFNRTTPYGVGAGDNTWRTGNGSDVPQNILVQSGGATINQAREVKGNFLLAGGTFTLNSDLSVNGGWTCSGGTFTPNAQTVHFIGTSNSQINAGGATAFYRVTINKTNPGAVSLLTNPMNVSNTLTLTNGIVTTGALALTLTNTASSGLSGGNTGSFINGALTWSGMNTAGTNFLFAVGVGSTYQPFTFNTISGAAPTVTVQAFAAAPAGTADGTSLTALSSTEYWTANVGGGSFTGSTISLGRQAALGALNKIGRSTTNAALSYASLGGTAATPNINNSNNTGASLGYFVMAQSQPDPTVTGTTANTPALGNTNSGYYGQTIYINGTNFATTGMTGTINGTVVTLTYMSATQMTAVVPMINSGAALNNITISVTNTNTGGSGSYTTWSFLGHVTNAAASYTVNTTWLGNVQPAVAATVTIAHNPVTLSAAANSAVLATVLSGANLNISGASGALPATTITNSGTVSFSSTGSLTATTFTNAGTLSWAAAGTLNIAAGGTLTNNATFTGGTGTVNFAGAGTVNGSTAITFGNITINTGAVTFSTVGTKIDGVFTINGGNVGNTGVSPIYTSNSTLNYAVIGGYNRYLEWSATSIGTIGTTPGYPNNVTVSAGTLTVYNGGDALPNTARAMAGNLQVNTGATFIIGALNAICTVGGSLTTTGTGSVNMSNTSAQLAVIGSVTNAGTLTLSSVAGGDLYVGGDFTKTGGTFTCNSRELRFTGSGTQTYSSNATENINFIRNSKTAGTLNLNTSFTLPTSGNAANFVSSNPTVIPSGVTVILSEGTVWNSSTAGGTVTVNGILRNTGTTGATITSTAVLTFGTTGTYDHNMTRSALGNLGVIPTATWSAGSTCLISGLTNPTAGQWFTGWLNPSFSNFTWATGGMTTIPTMGGVTLTVNETFTISNLGAAGQFKLGTNSSNTITCKNFVQSVGTMEMGSGTGIGTINCSGSFSNAGAIITETGSAVAHLINFNGTTTQTIDFSGTESNTINYTFNNANGYNLTGTINANSTVTRTNGNFAGAGNITYTGTTTLVYNNTTALTSSDYEWPSSNGPLNVSVTAAGGVTLHATRSLAAGGVLTISGGILSLGAGSNDLTVLNSAAAGITGTFSGSSYVRTNGTGQLKKVIVAADNVLPVGNAAYNPITINNAGTGDTYGVRVLDVVTTPAPYDATKIVNRYWSITEAVGGGSNLTFKNVQFNSTDPTGANYAAGTTTKLGLYTSSWTSVTSTVTGGPIYLSNSITLSGTDITAGATVAIGKDDAFNCNPTWTVSTGSVSGYVGDAMVISGTGFPTFSSATINGVTATINSQNATTVNLTIPTGISTVAGTVVLISGCALPTNIPFAFSGYVTKASTNWNTTTTWVGNAVPINGTPVTINHIVSLDVSADPSAITINTGGALSHNTNTFLLGGTNLTSTTLNGTAALTIGINCLTANSFKSTAVTLNDNSVFTNDNGGTVANVVNITNLALYGTSTYKHNAVGSVANGATSDFPGSGTRIFSATSNVEITKWANAGTGTIAALPASNSPGWGNLKINVGSLGADWNQAGNLTNVQGNLDIAATGGAARQFILTNTVNLNPCTIYSINITGGILAVASSSVVTAVLNVTTNLSINAGSFYGPSNNATGYTLHVFGNLSVDNAGIWHFVRTGGTWTNGVNMTIDGNLNIVNGTVTHNSNLTTYTLYVGGNTNMSQGTVLFANSNTAGFSVNFTTNGNYNQTGGTVTYNNSPGGNMIVNGSLNISGGTLQSTGTTSVVTWTVANDIIITGSSTNVSNAGTTSYTATNGKISITDGTFTGSGSASKTTLTAGTDLEVLGTGLFTTGGNTATAAALNIGRDIIINATNTTKGITGTSSGGFVISCTRHFNQLAGLFQFQNNTTAGGPYTLNLGGNFNLAGGTFTGGTNNTNANINMTGGTASVTYFQAGTINASKTNFNIKNGKAVTLTSNLNPNGTASTNNWSIIAETGSTIDCSTYQVGVGNNFTAFTLQTGATLKTAHTGGVWGAVNTASITTTNNSLSAGATYEFNGSSAQVTSLFATTPTATPYNVANMVVNNTAGVTMSQSLNVTSALQMNGTAGNLTLAGYDLTIANGASITTSGPGHSATKMIVTNLAGRLGRTVTTSMPLSLSYPVGNNGGYMPATYNFTVNSTSRVLYVQAQTPRNTNDASTTDYIDNRWWNTSVSDNSGSYTYTANYQFVSGDAVGTLANIGLYKWDGSTWNEDVGSSVAGIVISSGALSNNAVGSLASTAQWVGRTKAQVPIDYTWNNIDGSWSNKNNWTPVGVPGSADGVKFINSATTTVTNVPTGITLRRINIYGTENVTWEVKTTGTMAVQKDLTVPLDSAFFMASGTTLTLDGTSSGYAMALTINSANIAAIYGNFKVRHGDHTLIGTDAGSVSFKYGSIFTAGQTGDSPTFNTNPFGSSGTNGTVVFTTGSIFDYFTGANPFATNPTNSKVVFNSGSLYRHNSNAAFASSGVVYANVEYNFNGSSNNITASTNPIVMDTLTVSQGTLNLNVAGTPGHSIKGNVVVQPGATLSFAPASAGTVNFNGGVVQRLLGGGTITTNANSTLIVPTSATPNTLYCGTMVIGGDGTFTLNSGATLGIGHVGGISLVGNLAGNIQTTTARNFNTAANYIYNGSTGDQVSGTGLPATVNNLTIFNTTGANKVQMTNAAGTTINGALYLTDGTFDLNDKTVTLANGAANSIVLTGGRAVINGGSATGYINNTVSTCTISGVSTPTVSFGAGVTVRTSSGINFGSLMSTINGSFQIDNGGFNTGNSPYYGSGSTLVYNPGGSYNRSIEWGNNPGLPGYPHHVLVQNSTTLNLGAAIPVNLECAGNLTIGTSTSGSNIVTLNALSMPLKVLGNLVIGDNATSGSRLTLSTAAGGDLELSGNFTRYRVDNYFDNSALDATPHPRSIIFRGSTSTGVSATVQKFHDMQLQKTGTADVTLNCALFIESSANFTNGKINSTATNLLTFETAAVVTGTPSASSYVNGPCAKQVAVGSTTEFEYPIGKSTASPIYNPAGVKPVSITGSTTTFTAEYFAGPHEAQGVMGTAVLGIINPGYWDISNSNAANTARIKLYYTNPGAGNWIYYTGAGSSPFYTTAVDPCVSCNVAVVHRDAPNTWNFTGTYGTFSTIDPESRYYTNNGWIYSKAMSSFSPFSIGYAYDIILPVQLLSFTGKLQNSDGLLDWKVTDTRDLAGFELQHSRDGRSFSKLADVSNGNGSSNAYSYLHKQLPMGANFYRLLVKERNGNSAYSNVVLLSLGKMRTQIIGLRENPVRSHLSVMIVAATNQKASCQIADALGRLITRSETQLQAGQNQWNLQTQFLAKGMYFIQVQTQDGERSTIRFVKD